MDTNLVGYLLGNLDPETHRQVAEQLRRSPKARAALIHVRRTLGPLAALRSPALPPAGLARRTLARLAAHRQLPDAPPVPPGQRAGLRMALARVDLLVTALVVVVVLACLLPCLLACQRQAQVRQGQHNLARIWAGLHFEAESRDIPLRLILSDIPGDLLPGRQGRENARFWSALDLSVCMPGDDHWPLLQECPDREALADRGHNVLFTGGQVTWCDPTTAQLSVDLLSPAGRNDTAPLSAP